MHFVPTNVSDLDRILDMEKDPSNSSFIFPNSKRDHIDMIRDEHIAHLLIRSEQQDVVGFCILAGLKKEARSIELRRIIIQEKGKGYGRKAIRQLKQHCFVTLKAHRLWLDVFAFNERARALYRSEGFQEEVVLRASVRVEDRFEDLIIMSILEDAYAKKGYTQPR